MNPSFLVAPALLLLPAQHGQTKSSQADLSRTTHSPAVRADGETGSRFRVTVVEEDGELFCSLEADNAPWIDVLTEIAKQARLDFDGVGQTVQKMLLSSDLRHRPLRQVLTYVGGSLGLRLDVRQNALLVRDGDASALPQAELLDAALANYMRVARDFPEHNLSADARLAHADIEELRGHSAAARASFDALIQQHPDSLLAPQALFRCAQSLQRDLEWRGAVEKYSRLLRSEHRTGYELPARLELAWCVARLGENERALYMVDALEVMQTPRDDAEALRRGQIRVRALAGLGDGQRALELLDDLELRFGPGADKRESLELRAATCAAAMRPLDASRAWLSLSQLVNGQERVDALAKAGSAALQADDPLGALFVCSTARAEGVELGELERRARAALQLDDELDTSPLGRLERAEEMLASEPSARALALLGEVQAHAAELDLPSRVRLEIAIARAMAASASVDEALAHFRAVLPGIDAPEERRRIYVVAAELLEHESRIDESIEALRGRL